MINVECYLINFNCMLLAFRDTKKIKKVFNAVFSFLKILTTH